jgi:phospholipid transport system substrate-binding protein
VQKANIFSIDAKINNQVMSKFMKKFNISKIIAAFVIMFSFLSSSTNAGEPTVATNYISDLAHNIASLLSKKDLNPETKDQQLKEIFLTNVDTKWIARFVMGKHWRSLSASQQEEYQNLFSKFLIANYIPYFKNYNTDKVKILSSKEIGAEEYIVNSEISVAESNNPVRLDYRIIRKPDTKQFVIFDVVVEGVSLIATQRSEIDSVMSSSSFDKVLNLIKQKTASASAKTSKK